MKKLHNGQIVDMTAEEVTELQNLVAEANAHEQAKADAETQKANLKASAKAKLVAGEPLTEAEADTLVI
jgi:hypothetical protein|tara:strand:+ start:646 stop:852 length:207 start_codon:yes stop_codon:yes gene_type:complete